MEERWKGAGRGKDGEELEEIRENSEPHDAGLAGEQGGEHGRKILVEEAKLIRVLLGEQKILTSQT